MWSLARPFRWQLLINYVHAIAIPMDLLNLHLYERVRETSSRICLVFVIMIEYATRTEEWLFDFCQLFRMIGVLWFFLSVKISPQWCQKMRARPHSSLHILKQQQQNKSSQLIYLVVAAAASCYKITSIHLMHAEDRVIVVQRNYRLCMYLLFHFCLENVCFRFRVLFILMLALFLFSYTSTQT